MSIPPLTDMVDLVAEHLLNGLILSAGIFVAGIVLLPLLFGAKRWSAATRHRVSLLTFVMLASTPLLVVFKPAQPNNPVSTAQPVTTQVLVSTISASPEINLPALSPVSLEQNAPSPAPVPPTPWLDKVDWPLILFAAWALLAGICLLRLGAALYRLRVLHRSAEPVPLTPGLLNSRRISIAESPLVSSPVAVGLWPAKVLLPLGFQSEFSLAEQKNVLLHESAHLERFDDWTTFLQQLLLAIFPINPFLWVISRFLQLHQEAACDDRVLAETQQAKSYASLLARLAAGNTEQALLAPGVSRQGKQLYQRLSRILDATRNRSVHPSVRSVIAACVSLLGAGIAGLVWMPAVVWTSPAQANETISPAPPFPPEPAKSSLDPEIVSLLTGSALNDPDPGVRQEAVCALSEHDGADITTALLSLFSESKDEQVKLSILHRMTLRRTADSRMRDKLNDLALHETSVSIRTAAIELLSRHLDDNSINQLITIYRTAKDAPVRAACLTGLGATDSKAAREFLVSVAKEDPEPGMRCIALRAITNDHLLPEQVVIDGRRIEPNAMQENGGGVIFRRAFEARQKVADAKNRTLDAFHQQMDAYQKSLDTRNRLEDEDGMIITRRIPDGLQFGIEGQRFFKEIPGPGERNENDGPPQANVPPPEQLPQMPKVDPSPKPSPSASE